MDSEKDILLSTYYKPLTVFNTTLPLSHLLHTAPAYHCTSTLRIRKLRFKKTTKVGQGYRAKTAAQITRLAPGSY